MKRLFYFCLSASLLVLLSKSPIALANTGTELKKQIHQLEKKRQSTLNDLQDKQAELNNNKEQQSSIANQVQQLESQIQDSNYKIQVKQNSITAKQQEIQTLKDNIAMLQNRIEDRKSLIEKRARAAYINGGSINYLRILLDSKNFYDFVNRMYFVNKIAQQDQSILKKQVSDKQELDKNQKVLQTAFNKMNSDLKNLKELKASLDGQKAKEQTLLNQLKSKANQIKVEATNQIQQAAYYKQQEDAHKQELMEWEKQLLQNSNIPNEIKQFVSPAQQLEQSTGIPTAITLAQIILESGGHLSELATAGKNLFGIKGEGPAGTIYLKTHEVIGGTEITIEAGFKKYNTYYQSMVDHAKILNHSRYQYFLKQAHSLEAYAYGIQNGGYSTDPNYAVKLLTIIKDYGLARYDTGSF